MRFIFKSSAIVLFSLIVAYSVVSTVNPDYSQTLRDEWRVAVRSQFPLPEDVVVVKIEVTATPLPPTSTPVPTPTVAPSPTPAPRSGLSDESLEALTQTMLSWVNKEREDLGRRPLRLSSNTAAQEHAEDMMRNCYQSHVGRDGSDHTDRYIAAGGFRFHLIGENISGYNYCLNSQTLYVKESLEEKLVKAHVGLVGSPGHFMNIVSGRFHEIALGFAYRHPLLWVVQLFVGY